MAIFGCRRPNSMGVVVGEHAYGGCMAHEDPASGGHEAFLSEVLPHGALIEHFEAENLSEIRQWLEEEESHGEN